MPLSIVSLPPFLLEPFQSRLLLAKLFKGLSSHSRVIISARDVGKRGSGWQSPARKGISLAPFTIYHYSTSGLSFQYSFEPLPIE
jgi:hypothetical protein